MRRAGLSECGLGCVVAAVALLAGCFQRHGSDGSDGGDKGDKGSQGDRAGTGGTQPSAGKGSVGSAGRGSAPNAGGTGGTGPGRDPSPLEPGPSCVGSGTVREITIDGIDQVDLLFVIDDSATMAEEQAALRAAFPGLVAKLATGDMNGDGEADLPPAKTMHLGVVTTDLGAPGVSSIDGCEGLGDDALMSARAAPPSGCRASYPAFLTFVAGVESPEVVGSDLACIADVRTEGCAFTQPLEAGLKALWPRVDPMAIDGMNRIQFLGDAQGFGKDGQGDGPNLGFTYMDNPTSPSVLAIVVVTDDDDCSSRDARHFKAPDTLDPIDPLAQQDPNLRCHFNPDNLYVIERYAYGYKALRPTREDLVLLSAIAGVPPDLVEPEDYAAVDGAGRDGLYDRIYNDPRMQEIIDPDRKNTLLNACQTAQRAARPARRLLNAVRSFGENGSIHSICEEDFGPALTMVAQRIAARLGPSCLDRALAREADGLVDCRVEWELPPPGAGSPRAPTTCQSPGFEFLRVPSGDRARVNARGGANCEVVQLPVRDGSTLPGRIGTVEFADGWYYDDFSEEISGRCLGRVGFSPTAKPPTGVDVRLYCPADVKAEDACP